MSLKNLFRIEGRTARQRERDPAGSAEAALRLLCGLPEYRQADTVLWYLGCRDELPTMAHVQAELAGTKRIAIPCCTEDAAGQPMLKCWHLTRWEELQPGRWGILEPRPSRHRDDRQWIDANELDLVVAPGVAFDVLGNRIGSGKGYYDRLLCQTRAACRRVGLGFESQVFDLLPAEPHDITMHYVITERTVYVGQGGSTRSPVAVA